MTNMKDSLRTDRDTKAKFEAKSRSINIKAKEKLLPKKDIKGKNLQISGKIIVKSKGSSEKMPFKKSEIISEILRNKRKSLEKNMSPDKSQLKKISPDKTKPTIPQKNVRKKEKEKIIQTPIVRNGTVKSRKAIFNEIVDTNLKKSVKINGTPVINVLRSQRLTSRLSMNGEASRAKSKNINGILKTTNNNISLRKPISQENLTVLDNNSKNSTSTIRASNEHTAQVKFNITSKTRTMKDLISFDKSVSQSESPEKMIPRRGPKKSLEKSITQVKSKQNSHTVTVLKNPTSHHNSFQKDSTNSPTESISLSSEPFKTGHKSIINSTSGEYLLEVTSWGGHVENNSVNASESKKSVKSPTKCILTKPKKMPSKREYKPKPKKKSRPHICKDCGKAFLYKNDLNKHNLIHAGLKPFECKFCEKTFRQAVNLRNHITSYHTESIENPKTFSCDHCGKTFLIKERLRLHLRIHTGHRPYICDHCPMSFARIGQLRQHAYTHSGERRFGCQHCEASFTCAAKLKLHVKGHFDIREYTCYLCGKSFIRPDAIKKHLACFHNGEKPFTCPICNKSLKGHLQEHMRTHRSEKPHNCKECGNSFTQRSQLTVHLRKHSGARPYRCRVCWKAFAHSTALKLHTRRHTGEKPFTCRLCEAQFSQLPHMKKHMLYVHKDKHVYLHRNCKKTFYTKSELEKHILECTLPDNLENETPEEKLSREVSEAFQQVEPPMALSKMRLLLAILLNKISNHKKLKKLGFNKRLIDDILVDSLVDSGHDACTDMSISPAQRLKKNIQQFLEWTVPKNFMEKFRNEHKSTEELLEELTS